VEHVLVLDEELLSSGSSSFQTVQTSSEDPAQLYYSSGTTGLAKGILHAHRYILAHEEFIYCHDVQDGELFHGMGEWAWAAGICPLIGPWRLGAVQAVYQREGGFDPHSSLTSSPGTKSRTCSERRRRSAR
jgi:acetyl-CoA synthetase